MSISPEEWHFLKKSLSVRKLPNLAKVGASYCATRLNPKSPRVWGIPPALMIEPTAFCNLKCPLCPSGNGTLDRARGFMDFDLYRRIIDEIRNRTYIILLWGQGESFLHKQFLEMIRYAHDAGIYTMVSTNGHYLKEPEAVVESGLDTLIISMDGATQETYAKYRVGGDIDTVLEGARGLQEAKKRIGSKTPYTRMQFIIFKHNEEEVGRIAEIASELGLDRMSYKTAQIYEENDVEKYLPSDLLDRRYVVTDDGFALRGDIKDRCRVLFKQPVVNWDGTVTPCCFDKHGHFVHGKLGQEQSLAEIWNNREFNAFRRTVFTNRMSLDICTNCGEGVKLYRRHENIQV